jgi:hypothetical protein
MTKIELPIALLEYKDPIVYVYFNKDVLIDEKQLLELIEVRNKLVNYKKHLVLTTFSAVVDFTEEARKAAASADVTHTSIAHAVVVRSLGQRLVSGFYKKIDRPHYPIEIFNNQEDAEKWLLSFLKKKK